MKELRAWFGTTVMLHALFSLLLGLWHNMGHVSPRGETEGPVQKRRSGFIVSGPVAPQGTQITSTGRSYHGALFFGFLRLLH